MWNDERPLSPEEEEAEAKKAEQKLLSDPRVSVNDDGTKTVILSVPVERKGLSPIEEVTFRKPKGKDWLAADRAKGKMEAATRMAASISGLPYEVFLEMDGDDMLLCVGISGLMGKK